MSNTTTHSPGTYEGNGKRINLGLSTTLVQTRFFRDGFLTAQATLDENNIVAFDGPPGTGKTTCARFVAQHVDRPCAVATMPHRPAPLDILRHISQSLTGLPPQGTRFDMQNDLVNILSDWQGVLIIDELQNTKTNGLQELVWLYEETNHAFGIVVVGTGVITSVRQYPQLHSRIMGTTTFKPLRGADLISAVQSLDARLKATPPALLAQHDQAACAGILRRWIQTVRWLDQLQVSGSVNASEFKAISTRLPALATTKDLP